MKVSRFKFQGFTLLLLLLTLAAVAQPVPPTTAFTRYLLSSTNQAQFQTRAGVGTNGAALDAGVTNQWKVDATNAVLGTALPAANLTGTVDDARLPATISSDTTGNAATVTSIAGNAAQVAAMMTTNVAGSSSNLTVSSYVPTRGLTQHPEDSVPNLTVHWIYVRSGVAGGADWFTNLTYYASNLIREFKTNGMYAAGWRNFEIDSGFYYVPPGQEESHNRVPAGQMTWNTNYFENSRLPMSLPQMIQMFHDNGWRIYSYRAMTTNHCEGPPSPIQFTYGDTQTEMSWGFDGVQLDHCNSGVAPGGMIDDGQTSEYYRQYVRIMNQAIEDYWSVMLATNGPVRPFKIMVTGSSGESWTNSINADLLYGVSETQFQPTIISLDLSNVAPMDDPGITNQASLARDACTLFRPFFRPGHIPWSGIGIYGNTGQSSWSNNLAFYTLSCSPVKAGLGSVLGMFNAGAPLAGDQWKDVFFPSYSQFWTNHEVMEMLSDPLVIPATITYTNENVEVWIRPLENGDYCLGISNLGLTNRTVNFTAADLRINPSFNYRVRDVWGKAYLNWNPNAFTHTQTPESISLFRLVKQRLNNSLRQLDVTWPMKSLTFSGMQTNTVAYSGPGSFGAVEGLYQLNGSTACGFNVPMPAWANRVTVVGRYYSDLAGTHAWTNFTYLRYHTPAANSVAYDSGAYPQYAPQANVVCTSGNWVVVTNTGVFPIVTNTPKQFYIQMNASTNAANRFIIGSLDVRFEE